MTTFESHSQYCSQPLFHFALELDGAVSVSHRLDLRTRHGATYCYWRNFLGTRVGTVPGLPTLDQAQSLVEPYIREVSERRRQMRK